VFSALARGFPVLVWSSEDPCPFAVLVVSLSFPRVLVRGVEVCRRIGRTARVVVYHACDLRFVKDRIVDVLWSVLAEVFPLAKIVLREFSRDRTVLDVELVRPIGRRGHVCIVAGDVGTLVTLAECPDRVVATLGDAVTSGYVLRIGEIEPIALASLDSEGTKIVESISQEYACQLPEYDISISVHDLTRAKINGRDVVLRCLRVCATRSVSGLLAQFLVPDAYMMEPWAILRIRTGRLLENFGLFMNLLDHGLDRVSVVMGQGHGKTLLLVRTMLETFRRRGHVKCLYFRQVSNIVVEPYRGIVHVLSSPRYRPIVDRYINVRTLDEAVKLCQEHDLALLLDDHVPSPETLRVVKHADCVIAVSSSVPVRGFHRLELDGRLDIGDARTYLRHVRFRDIEHIPDSVVRRLLDLSNRVPKRFVKLLHDLVQYCRSIGVDTNYLTNIIQHIDAVVK